jgi:flagellar protein FliO/FliZ
MGRFFGGQITKSTGLVIGVVSATPVWAQEAAKGAFTSTQVHQNAGGGSFIWLTLVTLVLAAVLVSLIAWFVKRNLQIDVPNSTIKVLTSQSLGPRERIVIAQIVGRVFVLSHTPTQISVIAELDAAEVASLPKTSQHMPDFAKKLSDLLRKGIKA